MEWCIKLLTVGFPILQYFTKRGDETISLSIIIPNVDFMIN